MLRLLYFIVTIQPRKDRFNIIKELMSTIKKLISPIQKVLLAKGMCVGCSMPLSKSKEIIDLGNNLERVTCKCERIYIHDTQTDTYRRALVNEA